MWEPHTIRLLKLNPILATGSRYIEQGENSSFNSTYRSFFFSVPSLWYISLQADVYSLGVVFHTMLCTKYPYGDCGNVEIDDSIVDQEVRELLSRMLHPNPSIRPYMHEIIKMKMFDPVRRVDDCQLGDRSPLEFGEKILLLQIQRKDARPLDVYAKYMDIGKLSLSFGHFLCCRLSLSKYGGDGNRFKFHFFPWS